MFAKPLVSYIDKALGHPSRQCSENHGVSWARSNIASLLTALDFKPYQLHDQTNARRLAAKSFSSVGMTAKHL